jgi:predicted PurR-regulated permease PerM
MAMNETSAFSSWQRTLIIFGSIALIVGGLSLAKSILVPIALAILFTLILTPVVSFVQRYGLRRIPATILVLLLTLGMLGLFGFIVLDQVRSLVTDLPQYKKEIGSKIDRLREESQGFWLNETGKLIAEISRAGKSANVLTQGEGGKEPIPVTLTTSNLSLLESVVSPAFEFLAVAGVVIVLVSFMLSEREDLRNRLIKLWGEGSVTTMTKAIDDAVSRISRYLLMQLIINLAMGSALGVGLFLIGVPYAVLWAVLAAVLRFIPYIGIWVAAFFPVLLSIVVAQGWMHTVLVLILFLALEAFTANVIEPWLFGQSIGVSPVALLIAAVFWTWIWGPIGLVLSTPLTACLAVLGKYVPAFEFFHVLLGDEERLDAHVLYYQRLLAHDPDEAADLVDEYLADHSTLDLCDRLLIPALALAKLDRSRDKITAGELDSILKSTREIFDNVIYEGGAGGKPDETEPEENAAKILVLGCPASDEVDHLALYLFSCLLPRSHCELKLLSADKLSGEIVARVSEENPGVIIIASLPPRGGVYTNYLCKRIRARFSEVFILVGCWGWNQDGDKIRRRLRAAGATQVGLTFADSLALFTPELQHQSHQPESAGEPAHT